MTVYLDCDGTWIDLYGVDNWLEYLINEDVYPYKMAKPLVNLSTLARTIHRLQENNIKVGIISWLSKNGSEDYNRRVAETKLNYFKTHLPSVVFDEIHIVEYGTPKSECATDDFSILFDDEEKNRVEWNGIAFTEKDLIKTMLKLL